MQFEVLLTRTRKQPSRSQRIVVETEALWVQAPDRRTARRYLTTNYPGWDLTRHHRFALIEHAFYYLNYGRESPPGFGTVLVAPRRSIEAGYSQGTRKFTSSPQRL